MKIQAVDLKRPLPSLGALLDVVEALERPGIREVLVEVGFVAPFGYACLEALRLSSHERGVELRLTSAPPPGFSRPFAEIIGFGGGGVGSATTVELRRFREGDDAAIGRYLLDEWAGRAERLSAVDAGYVVGSVGEVFANALTHAHSPIGVVACGQFFPASGNLHLSVVDLGIGIPASVATAACRREDEIDPAAAIAWAFERGHSTISTSRGLGLANLKTFMLRNEATLHVFSGHAYATLFGEVWRTATLDRRFPGTLIDLQLPTSKVRSPSPQGRIRP